MCMCCHTVTKTGDSFFGTQQHCRAVGSALKLSLPVHCGGRKLRGTHLLQHNTNQRPPLSKLVEQAGLRSCTGLNAGGSKQLMHAGNQSQPSTRPRSAVLNPKAQSHIPQRLILILSSHNESTKMPCKNTNTHMHSSHVCKKTGDTAVLLESRGNTHVQGVMPPAEGLCCPQTTQSPSTCTNASAPFSPPLAK